METLKVKDTQIGFAGSTGIITTILPDGTFTVSQFLNDRIEEPHQRGRLTHEALENLSQTLNEKDFLNLPQELGQAPPINSRIINVTLGDKTSTLFLEPGFVPLAAIPDQPESLEARLLLIVQLVEKLTA